MACMMQTEALIESCEANGQTIAGIVVEPIQGEGGDNWASANFFKQLQQMCKKVLQLIEYNRLSQ